MSRKDAKPENRTARLSFPLTEPKDEPSARTGEERAALDRLPADEYSQLAELKSSIGRISRLMLSGGSLEQALDAMEEVLGNPVAVIHGKDSSLRSSGFGAAAAEQAAAAAAAHVGREGGRRSGTDGFLAFGEAHRAYYYWIAGSGERQTAIALYELNRAIAPIDTLTLARMSAFVDLEMANRMAVQEVEGKYLDLFLQDWLSGKIVSERDWSVRTEVCGCELRSADRLCAILVGLPEAGAEHAEGRLAVLCRSLRSGSRTPGREMLAAPFGSELVLILSEGKAEGQEPAEGAAEASLQRLLDELRAELGMPALRLFAGRPVAQPELIPASLSQARRARQVAEVCGLAGDVVTYDKLGVYSLLYLIPGGEEREQFLRRYMVPLQQADRKGGGRLAETLEMFFRCNGNIKLTSEKLYAHYNTIVYRLDKIQSILGVSLDDPEDRLQLQLSLKLGQISPGSF
ncbi:PucR family transcriptional regulator [Cohnella sp. JJ-181]|uniref:PucR family transcriptional regulator n=1 Tax=Cohnella rhizoplanae TaxID=2974897 RepID=UPI00232A9E27|nr:helix-turn-helix domain-containing protein [Cohnella sp. JJ-181]